MASKQPKTLLDFEKAKRMSACKICSLPDDIRQQIAGAGRIKQAVVIEWLKSEHHIEVSRQDFTSHSSAHHDTWSADGITT